jgi:hypothetical protein
MLLSNEQQKNASTLFTDVIRGFGFGTSTVVSCTRDLTELEKAALITALDALPETPATQELAIKQFNMNQFWGQVYATLSPDAGDALMQFARGIELLWSYPNIEGIRPFLQARVGKAYNGYTVLQSDMDIIIGAFAAQGVEL